MRVGKASASENQEQAVALPRRQRWIFVPFRPAAMTPTAAQNPQSGVCHPYSSRDKPGFFCARWKGPRERKSGAGCGSAAPSALDFAFPPGGLAQMVDKKTRCEDNKTLGPAASVVCRRANIVLMTVPARQGGTARTQRQANSPLKGQRVHRRGCAFAEGCRL